MNDLFEYILAAGRKKPNDFSWVVPIVLVVFYGLAGLARVFNKSKEDQPKPEETQPDEENHRTSQNWQKQALRKQQHREAKLQRQETHHQQRYIKQHHIVTGDTEGGGIEDGRQTILRELMGQVYRQAEVKTPQPAHKAITRKPVRKEPVIKPTEKTLEKPPPIQTHGLSHLAELNELKKAIVYAEILGKPIALK